MVGMHSEVGNFRNINQDYLDYSIKDDSGIFIVADGMGGYAGGEVASKVAVTTMIKEFEGIEGNISEEKVIDMVRKCNSDILNMAKENTELKGMGTTLTFVIIKGDRAIIGNVGDSCCYILHDGELRKVTKDHSLVQALIDAGNISEEEAKVHPNKNIITRSLGTGEEVQCDLYFESVAEDTKILLCSDGLSNHIDNQKMKSIIEEYPEEEAVKIMSEISKENGSRDNISAMVFKGVCRDDR